MPATLAREMFFTAEPVSANRLERVGAITRLCDSPESAREAARVLADTIAQRAPLSITSIKAEISAQESPENADADELRRMRERAWAGDDVREGRAAFVERRPASFRGE